MRYRILTYAPHQLSHTPASKCAECLCGVRFDMRQFRLRGVEFPSLSPYKADIHVPYNILQQTVTFFP